MSPHFSPPSDADLPLLSAPPPLPPSNDASNNPWRIGRTEGGATAGSVTLMGEPPSSWPPLSSSMRLNDSPPLPPPPEIRPSAPAGIEEPIAADLTAAAASSSSSSTSISSELASYEETETYTTGSPAAAMMETPVSSSPPPAPTYMPAAAAAAAPSPGIAASANGPRQPRHPTPPQRRGGNQQKFQQHRGNAGYRYNNSYRNRPPTPGWRPNWASISLPQNPQWDLYPHSSVSGIPPANGNPPYVPYPHLYNGFYQNYGIEPYGNYYGYTTYEVPYAPPLSPVVVGLPPSQVVPSPSGVASLPPSPVHPSFSGVPSFPPIHEAQSSSGVAMGDRRVDVVKDQLLFQIEYYFSDVNLEKDTHLKSEMDCEGWVDIHEIARFRRVARQTDDINLIKEALQPSNVVELEGDRIRKRHEWHRWVSPRSSPNSVAVSMQSVRLVDQSETATELEGVNVTNSPTTENALV